MKLFNELTKKELSELNETQIDAYVDIELAGANITKPVQVTVDFPDYLSIGDALPERDLTIYQAGDYCFPNLETAQTFIAAINKLPTVRRDYDYRIGSEAYYASDVIYPTESITVLKVYSQAKFEAIKEQLKQIIEKQRNNKKEREDVTESVIDYSAIDEVKYKIINQVRDAIRFFEEANKIARDYDKYFAVTNEHEKTLEILFKVYNIQDDELKSEVISIISNKPEPESN